MIKPLFDIRQNKWFIPYIRDLSLTLGKSCVLGVESKLLLNKVSISVDLPIPVSPVNVSQQHNDNTKQEMKKICLQMGAMVITSETERRSSNFRVVLYITAIILLIFNF